MGLFGKLFSKSPGPATMTLEGEGLSPLSNPTEDDVRQAVLGLARSGTSFVSLADETGNYVQVAGSRPWCVLERRQVAPPLHERAFQETPSPKYADGAKISTGVGDIIMKSDEWFLLKDAADVFVAFLNRQAPPVQIQWRSLNEMLGL